MTNQRPGNTGFSLADTDHVTLILASDWSATTRRNILGTKTLADILAERESIAHDMQVRKKLASHW